MMKIWDRVEQTLVGVLGLAALAFALWQIVGGTSFRMSGLLRHRAGTMHTSSKPNRSNRTGFFAVQESGTLLGFSDFEGFCA
jgi:hypothetical protein